MILLLPGGQGSTGLVLELKTLAAHSARGMVKVEWGNGSKNVYRVGYEGKMDLQFVEEAPGLECYPQHLPVFGWYMTLNRELCVEL